VAHRVDWRPPAIEDMRALFEYLLEHASLWDGENVTEQVLRFTTALPSFRACRKPIRAMAMVSAASVLPVRTFCMRWMTRRKLSISSP
jgi:hypothetical protein